MTEAMREQFEAEAYDYSMPLARDSSGVYVDPDTQNAWFFYQAALRSPAVAGLVDAAEKVVSALDGRVHSRDALAAVDASRAALAPLTTGAGHVSAPRLAARGGRAFPRQATALPPA